jgi:hypothetical protein
MTRFHLSLPKKLRTALRGVVIHSAQPSLELSEHHSSQAAVFSFTSSHKPQRTSHSSGNEVVFSVSARKLSAMNDRKIASSEHLRSSVVILFPIRLSNPSTDICDIITGNIDFKNDHQPTYVFQHNS